MLDLGGVHYYFFQLIEFKITWLHFSRYSRIGDIDRLFDLATSRK